MKSLYLLIALFLTVSCNNNDRELQKCKSITESYKRSYVINEKINTNNERMIKLHKKEINIHKKIRAGDISIKNMQKEIIQNLKEVLEENNITDY